MKVKDTFKGYTVNSLIHQGEQWGQIFDVSKERQRFAMKEYNDKTLKQNKLMHQYPMESAAIQLDSPGIPQFYEVDVQYKGKKYIKMELVQGVSLKTVLSGESNLQEESVVFLVAQLVHTLWYLHKQGLCHRRLFADKILITSQGNIMLLGFRNLHYFDIRLLSDQMREAAREKTQLKQEQEKNKQKVNSDLKKFDEFQKNVKISEPCTASLTEEGYIPSPSICVTHSSNYQDISILGEECGLKTDLYLLGCLIYQMFTDREINLSEGLDRELLDERIPKKGKQFIKYLLNIRDHFVFGDLINKTQYRIHKTYENEILNHPFFEGFNVSQIYDMNNHLETRNQVKRICMIKEKIGNLNQAALFFRGIAEKSGKKDEKKSRSNGQMNQYQQQNYSVIDQDLPTGSKIVSKIVLSQFTEAQLQNLFFEIDIIKVNIKFLFFKTKKYRKVFLFNLEQLLLVYYMPSLKKKVCNQVIIDENTIVALEQDSSYLLITNPDQKYVFHDPQGIGALQLFNKIQELKELRRKKRKF